MTTVSQLKGFDLVNWLNNKLGDQTELWAGRSTSSVLTREIISELVGCFPALEAHVKLKIIESLPHISPKLLQLWRDPLIELLAVAKEDGDQWIRTLAQIYATYPRIGAIKSAIDDEDQQFAQTTKDFQKILEDVIPSLNANVIPPDFLIVSASTTAMTFGFGQDDANRHFKLRKESKATKMLQDALKASEPQNRRYATVSSTVPMRTKNPVKKVDNTLPMRAIPTSRTICGGFTDAPKKFQRSLVKRAGCTTILLDDVPPPPIIKKPRAPKAPKPRKSKAEGDGDDVDAQNSDSHFTSEAVGEKMADWESYLNNQENVDGVRMTWNVLPHSKADAQKMVVPPAVFFAPLKERPEDQPRQPAIEYDPVLCQKATCKAILNPLCPVDFRAKCWHCLFCNQRNPFPPHYNMIAEDNRPPELHPAFTTIEYTLKKATTLPPIFLFLVDTCVTQEELKALKESLQKALSVLPADSYVGLITYGRTVELRELDARNLGRSYVFSGAKEVTQKQIKDVLALNFGRPAGVPMAPAAPQQQQQPPTGLPIQPQFPGAPGQFPAPPQFQPQQMQQPMHQPMHQPMQQPQHSQLAQRPSLSGPPGAPQPFNKFLQPISECEQTIFDLIEQLTVDRWPIPQGHRPLRATGSALAVAVTLLETCFPNTGARIMTFIGGACTYGPGMVTNEELKQPIRSWHDIKEDKAVYQRKATKFYDQLAQRAVKNAHVVDIYSCALDQTGLQEMNNLFNSTNGHVIMADSFESTLFKQSFAKVFEKDADGNLKMGFNATMEVKLSAGLKIEGALGCCASAGVRNALVSDTEIGVGGTCQWKFCSLTPRHNVALLFEIAAPHGSPMPQHSRAMFQFVTQYQHADGRKRIRVTTTCRNWADMSTQQQNVAYGFDQEAAAVLMARMASFRAANENDSPDTMRWLDRSLIRLIQRFGEYHRDDPSSLRLSEKFSLYPQFMFHLRRSQFLQVFNNSPDETAYYRHVLFGENVSESTSMLQPVLFSYACNAPAEPVLLDTSSILPDRVLLMDDYFHVLIYHGQTVAQWRKARYHEDPQYVALKQMLEQPVSDAAAILQDRFPVPRYIVTEHEGSQARFLLSKVNPSLTHNNPYSQEGGAPVFTDDVSLQVFMEHLRKLAVSAST
ncbi:Protein transport protein SEC23 [Aphelenchoides besseyi]|nr:Protein transport protein SEC23 [Aphelenchoides besseyi]